MVGMIMGAGYPFDRMVSRTTVRRARSERAAPVYPAVYFVLLPLVSHLDPLWALPADGCPLPWGSGPASAWWGVRTGLWHGLRLAYRPLALTFNRLLREGDYVVLNLPGVRMR